MTEFWSLPAEPNPFVSRPGPERPDVLAHTYKGFEGLVLTKISFGELSSKQWKEFAIYAGLIPINGDWSFDATLAL